MIAREGANLLQLIFFVDLKVFFLEIRNEVAFLIGDGDGHNDLVDFEAKGGIGGGRRGLLFSVGGRPNLRGAERQADEEGGKAQIHVSACLCGL